MASNRSARLESERTPRRRASREQRRAEIVEAALGCFSAKGYHATTMDDLVQASGLSKGSLYWHFESKEDVFLALFDHIAEEIFGSWDEAAQSPDAKILDVLRSTLDEFVERFADERPLLLGWMEFLSHPRGRERMGAVYTEARAKIALLVRRGVERGELRDLPALSVAATFTGAVDALILQALVDPSFEVRDHLDTLWEILSGGVAR